MASQIKHGKSLKLASILHIFQEKEVLTSTSCKDQYPQEISNFNNEFVDIYDEKFKTGIF